MSLRTTSRIPSKVLLGFGLVAGLAGFAATAAAQSSDKPLGDGMVMYMQMGGNAGDGATLARTTGARDAARAFGLELIEQ